MISALTCVQLSTAISCYNGSIANPSNALDLGQKKVWVLQSSSANQTNCASSVNSCMATQIIATGKQEMVLPYLPDDSTKKNFTLLTLDCGDVSCVVGATTTNVRFSIWLSRETKSRPKEIISVYEHFTCK